MCQVFILCEGIKISYERRSMKMSVHAGRIINDLLQCANFKRKYFQAKAIKIGKNTIFIFFNVNLQGRAFLDNSLCLFSRLLNENL